RPGHLGGWAEDLAEFQQRAHRALRDARAAHRTIDAHGSRAGDPPTRRPVRELGNGPTDLALLASALERAAAAGT
ncbi:hypothetical protein CLM85_03555, partial [Streptomyces albidoflavus]